MGSRFLLACGAATGLIVYGCASSLALDIAVAGARDLAATVRVDCLVRAARVAYVKAGVSGKVNRVSVAVGSRVYAGQVLVRLANEWASANERLQSAAVAEARAVVERARLDVEAARVHFGLARDAVARYRTLLAGRHVSQVEHAEAARAVEVALGAVLEREAAAAEAESLLRAAEVDAHGARATRRETVVRAPFAGIVSRVHVAEGLQVQGPQGRYRGSALLDLEGVGITVETEVATADVRTFKAGLPVTVRVHAYPERAFEARVEAVGLESTGFGVRAIMSPLGDWAGVRPGFSCAAEVTTAARRAAVAVPRLALLSRDDRLGVWRVEDGRVSFAPVSVGVRGDVFVEVLSGLASGDRVVIGPFDVAGTLEPGQRVQPAVRKFNGF